ncbi:hypothetical protein G1C96_0647 [Bifidobacterium sp. DSM 109958]|uniref:DUF4190 domain-containing protein n=1 Tax=Bifidobacterium moraviense TaxID=2675323 RepID=A0A7Y0HZC4_9BIFI|nr:DUF4190 domain-containing protein [Bifidobacterium sp. DSM 109958]NMN00070.1 hypothetical protein [Bifidobacterium sp. DSM 109958]
MSDQQPTPQQPQQLRQPHGRPDDRQPIYGTPDAPQAAYAPYAQQPTTQYTPQYDAPYGAQYGTNQYAQTPFYAAQQPAYPVGAYPYAQPPAARPWNSLSIVGLVLAFVVPPAGLIVSVIALLQIGRTGERGKGLSVAGIVLGVLNTLLIVLSVVFVFWAIGSAMQDMSYYGYYDDMSPDDMYDMDDMLGQFTGYVAAMLPTR